MTGDCACLLKSDSVGRGDWASGLAGIGTLQVCREWIMTTAGITWSVADLLNRVHSSQYNTTDSSVRGYTTIKAIVASQKTQIVY